MIQQQYTLLWENIRNFPINNPDSSFNFSDKLQKENNWSAAYTKRVVDEYRKFIFLCCVLPNGASPSEPVDKVWHMHLTYTVNYWEDFCKNTLHRDLHHHPSKGGPEERTKHDNWYFETLSAYQEIFETIPPDDIWPPSAFEPALSVDIYDRKVLTRSVLLFTALVILAIIFIPLFSIPGPDFLKAFAFIALAALAQTYYLQRHKNNRLKFVVEQNFPLNASIYQKAKFIYGSHRSYQAMLVDLVRRSDIKPNGKLYILKGNQYNNYEENNNPLRDLLYENVGTGNSFSYAEGFGYLNKENLDHPKLKLFYKLAQKVDYPKFIIPGIVFILFIARLSQGMSNEKPVGLLVFETALFGLLTMMILAEFSYTTSLFKLSKKYWESTKQTDTAFDPVAASFSLMGMTAIAGFLEYDDLRKNFNLYPPLNHGLNLSGNGNSSVGGCSSGGGCSGDGGGGDGGGCGGCGGCGGD